MTSGYQVVAARLAAFGPEARGYADAFGEQAALLAGVTLPADAFGKIASSSTIAAALDRCQTANVDSLKQAREGCGFYSEALPAAGWLYEAACAAAANGYLGIFTGLEALGGSSDSVSLSGSTGSTGSHVGF